MCKICDAYRDDARAQAEYVNELRGMTTAAEATLGDLRGRLAEHAARHTYRDSDDPPPFTGWSS